jgi:hypothetical protein
MNDAILTAVQVIVVARGAKWVVRSCTTKRALHFTDLKQAAGAAIDIAEKSGKDGRPAEVLLVVEDKKTKLWCYGQDTYPPEASFLQHL